MAPNETRVAGPLARPEFERDVILRAQADADFRKALLADPRTTLCQAYGIEIPPSVELQVLEETPDRLYLVLPAARGPEELSDDDLAQVAGGAGHPQPALQLSRRLQ